MTIIQMHITRAYKVMLLNTVFALSIVLLTIIGLNFTLIILSPNWCIKLINSFGFLMSIMSAWLIYAAISHFEYKRKPMTMIKWIVSFVCLLIGLIPIVLYVYLNLDWQLLALYGKNIFYLYMSFENVVLPVVILLFVCLVYWILTIQLYKKSYITFLCINKKEMIYGK